MHICYQMVKEEGRPLGLMCNFVRFVLMSSFFRIAICFLYVFTDLNLHMSSTNTKELSFNPSCVGVSERESLDQSWISRSCANQQRFQLRSRSWCSICLVKKDAVLGAASNEWNVFSEDVKWWGGLTSNRWNRVNTSLSQRWKQDFGLKVKGMSFTFSWIGPFFKEEGGGDVQDNLGQKFKF